VFRVLCRIDYNEGEMLTLRRERHSPSQVAVITAPRALTSLTVPDGSHLGLAYPGPRTLLRLSMTTLVGLPVHNPMTSPASGADIHLLE